MRSTALILLFLGTIFLGRAAEDEWRRVTREQGDTGARVMGMVVRRSENPVRFRQLMLYQWGRTGVCFVAAWLVYRLGRRIDRSDPFSDNFSGNKVLDELNRELDEEQRKRDRPLP